MPAARADRRTDCRPNFNLPTARKNGGPAPPARCAAAARSFTMASSAMVRSSKVNVPSGTSPLRFEPLTLQKRRQVEVGTL